LAGDCQRQGHGHCAAPPDRAGPKPLR
jgi:hypothetical protein